MTREHGSEKPAPKAPGRGSPRKSPGQIDENLRRVYREMVDEEVPDRFQQLIEELRRTEQLRKQDDPS